MICCVRACVSMLIACMFLGCVASAQCIDPRYQKALDWIRRDSVAFSYLELSYSTMPFDVMVADTILCPEDHISDFSREIDAWIDSLPATLYKHGTPLQLGIQCDGMKCPCLSALSTTTSKSRLVSFSQFNPKYFGDVALTAELTSKEISYDGMVVFLFLFDRENQIVRAWRYIAQE